MPGASFQLVARQTLSPRQPGAALNRLVGGRPLSGGGQQTLAGLDDVHAVVDLSRPGDDHALVVFPQLKGGHKALQHTAGLLDTVVMALCTG